MNDEVMARAIAKHVRMSPRKIRRVVNIIRGKNVNHARNILKFMPYAAAKVVEKVLKSAVSNAKENDDLNPDDLVISKAFVDQSTTLRRWRAVSKGRGYPILKRASHVTIEVESENQKSEVRDQKPKDQKTRRPEGKTEETLSTLPEHKTEKKKKTKKVEKAKKEKKKSKTEQKRKGK